MLNAEEVTREGAGSICTACVGEEYSVRNEIESQIMSASFFLT